MAVAPMPTVDKPKMNNRETTLYDVRAYGDMIADSVRVARYREALAQTVTPECRVLDLGAGAGLFSLIAARLGAGHVFAVEPGEAIQIGRDIARANGLDGQISFLQERGADVTLDRPVDVLVSDVRGVLPLFRGAVAAIRDARDRLLATDGAMLPLRDHIDVAIVEAPDLHARIVAPWDSGVDGIDMSAGRQLAVNRWSRASFGVDQLISEAQRWTTLDYPTIAGPNVSGVIRLPVTRQATAHGMAIWFDTELTDEVGLSNAPGEPELFYRTAFFPWPSGLRVAAGDVVEVDLMANLVGSDYLWRWETRVFDGGSDTERHPRWRQSTFHGVPLSLATLHAADREPR